MCKMAIISYMKYKTQRDESEQSYQREGHFPNLYVFNFLSCVLRLPAFASWHRTVIGKQLHKQVSSCSWGFQFRSTIFVHMNDLIDPLRSDRAILHFTASMLVKSALFQHHSGTTDVNMNTQSSTTGINSHISRIFWETVAEERHLYRKERMVQEKEHRWSPVCLIERRCRNLS